MTLKGWQFINIFLSTLVVGVFWGPWLGLSRSIASFPPETFLAIGQKMIANLAPVMPVLMSLAILSTLPSPFLMWRRRSAAFRLTLVGFLLFVIALVVTLVVEVPIDNQIKAWTVASLPPDWSQLRDRWESFHVIRTFASVIGLAFMLAGAIFETEPAALAR